MQPLKECSMHAKSSSKEITRKNDLKKLPLLFSSNQIPFVTLLFMKTNVMRNTYSRALKGITMRAARHPGKAQRKRKMSETQAPQPRHKRRILLAKIFAAGVLLALLAVVIPFLIMFIGACLTPAPPPAFTLASTRLLNPQKLDTRPMPARKDGPTSPTTAALAHEDRASSQTQSTAPRLRYPEFIRDLPDLPPKLRALRDSLNLKFDRLLGDVAEYEKIKATLTAQAQKAKLDAIDRQSQAIWGEINKATGNRLTMKGAQELMERRNQEYLKWYDSAMIENAGERGRWQEAARYSESLLLNLKFEWEEPHWRNTPNEPVFKSDYYRQQGTQDWRRLIYCYRQAGGMDGYGKIAAEVYRRGKETVTDGISRFVWNHRQKHSEFRVQSTAFHKKKARAQ